MNEYEHLSSLINDERVFSILNSAVLPEEVCLLGKVVKKNQYEEVFEMYSFSRNLLATIIKKRGDINQWHIRLEGNWKVDIF